MMKSSLVMCALIAVAATPATAQQVAANSVQQNGQAAQAQSSKPAKAADAKVCKRLPQGKVCMTEKKWKEYEQIM